jgi:hypothetical protein
MNEIYERKRAVTILALNHYIERLKKLQQDRDIGRTGTEPLANDIQNEISNAEGIITHIKEKGFEIKSEFASKIFEENAMKETLRASLLCYYKDMVESTILISEALPVKPEFKLLNKEIEFCKSFLNQIHESYGMNTKIE